MADGRLRRARRPDVPALCALEEHFPTDRLSRDNLDYLLTQGNARLWVWEERGQILSSAVVLFRSGSRRARIYSLITHPAHRGRGLGSRLLSAVEHHARHRGCLRLTLELRTDNHAARRLYVRHGFRETGLLAEFYQDGSDAWRMEKPLRSPRVQPAARAA